MIETIKSEFGAFPHSVNDDIVDAVAYGVIFLKRRYKGNPFTEDSIT